jgi:hypothetical protein
MEHHIGNACRPCGHEHGHDRMLTLEKWKTSHMILMRMGENGGANVVATEVL